MLNDGQSGASVENRLPHTQHCTRLFLRLGALLAAFDLLVVLALVVVLLVVVLLVVVLLVVVILAASVVLLEAVVILTGHET